jgi:ABC-type amino acid transport substrate-binding protein
MSKKFLLILIFILLFSSCVKQEIEKNEIRCIIAGKIPPFAYYENYDLVGFEIDLMKMIGEKIKKKIIFENLDGSQVLLNLERQYADIAISTFVITKERQKNFLMLPYHKEKIVFLFNRLLNDFKNSDDFKKSRKNEIASIYGVFNKDFLEWFKRNFKQKKITYFFNEILTIYALNNNLISGVLMTKSEAESLKKSKQKEYDYFEFGNLEFDFGILIQKNNKKLYSKISKAIDELKASGEFDELKKKYLISE